MYSKNKNIAIVAGGEQSEVVVSMKSAEGVRSFLSKKDYNCYLVVIEKNNWHVVLPDNTSLPIDKNDFSFTLAGKKITFDCAYNTVHGIPGEDGRLQGYFELIDMPYTDSSVLASALTFDKFACNHFLKGFGIKVAPSVLVRKGETIDEKAIFEKVGLPCFVKPNRGGSSFGVTKVKSTEELKPAIEKAIHESEEVIIECFMKGTEIANGIFKTSKREVVLPITEVVPANEFFDYDAKYNGEVEEITPARLSPELTADIQAMTSRIYNLLGCYGIARVDYIITEGNTINLLEVNTNPGLTQTSFIPQQAACAGFDFGDILEEIIEASLPPTPSNRGREKICNSIVQWEKQIPPLPCGERLWGEAVREFLSQMGNHTVFALYGAMGVGKTTFVKALCEEMGVKDVVNSPTFSIINEYGMEGKKSVYHFDFYRINKQEEAFDFGYEDYFYSGNLCLIEWPEKIEPLLPPDCVKVYFTEQEDGSRVITIK